MHRAMFRLEIVTGAAEAGRMVHVAATFDATNRSHVSDNVL